jgi:hypothetical protein
MARQKPVRDAADNLSDLIDRLRTEGLEIKVDILGIKDAITLHVRLPMEEEKQ